MKHTTVKYTCDGCGTPLPNGHTEMTARSSDPEVIGPPDCYELCAVCWLEIRATLTSTTRGQQRAEREDTPSSYPCGCC